jgi:hypothetical protein
MVRTRPELRYIQRTASNPSAFGSADTGLNPNSAAGQPFLEKVRNVQTTNRKRQRTREEDCDH